MRWLVGTDAKRPEEGGREIPKWEGEVVKKTFFRFSEKKCCKTP